MPWWIQRRAPSAYSFDVFLSHAGSGADKPFATMLRQVLQTGWEMEVFLDETDLRCGTNPKQRMQKAIEESQVGMLLFSNDFFTRTATRGELEFLLKRHKEHRIQLLPVFLRMTVEAAKKKLASIRGAGSLHACIVQGAEITKTCCCCV